MILVCQPMSQWVNESMSQSANQPNGDPVVRDQKVLPDVRNRPLLPRDFAGIQPSIFFRDPVGEYSVLIIQYPLYRWHQAEAWEDFGIRGCFQKTHYVWKDNYVQLQQFDKRNGHADFVNVCCFLLMLRCYNVAAFALLWYLCFNVLLLWFALSIKWNEIQSINQSINPSMNTSNQI